jgi:hypothetical protein
VHTERSLAKGGVDQFDESISLSAQKQCLQFWKAN